MIHEVTLEDLRRHLHDLLLNEPDSSEGIRDNSAMIQALSAALVAECVYQETKQRQRDRIDHQDP